MAVKTHKYETTLNKDDLKHIIKTLEETSKDVQHGYIYLEHYPVEFRLVEGEHVIYHSTMVAWDEDAPEW